MPLVEGVGVVDTTSNEVLVCVSKGQVAHGTILASLKKASESRTAWENALCVVPPIHVVAVTTADDRYDWETYVLPVLEACSNVLKTACSSEKPTSSKIEKNFAAVYLGMMRVVVLGIEGVSTAQAVNHRVSNLIPWGNKSGNNPPLLSCALSAPVEKSRVRSQKMDESMKSLEQTRGDFPNEDLLEQPLEDVVENESEAITEWFGSSFQPPDFVDQISDLDSVLYDEAEQHRGESLAGETNDDDEDRDEHYGDEEKEEFIDGQPIGNYSTIHKIPTPTRKRRTLSAGARERLREEEERARRRGEGKSSEDGPRRKKTTSSGESVRLPQESEAALAAAGDREIGRDLAGSLTDDMEELYAVMPPPPFSPPSATLTENDDEEDAQPPPFSPPTSALNDEGPFIPRRTARSVSFVPPPEESPPSTSDEEGPSSPLAPPEYDDEERMSPTTPSIPPSDEEDEDSEEEEEDTGYSGRQIPLPAPSITPESSDEDEDSFDSDEEENAGYSGRGAPPPPAPMHQNDDDEIPPPAESPPPEEGEIERRFSIHTPGLPPPDSDDDAQVSSERRFSVHTPGLPPPDTDEEEYDGAAPPDSPPPTEQSGLTEGSSLLPSPPPIVSRDGPASPEPIYSDSDEEETPDMLPPPAMSPPESDDEEAAPPMEPPPSEQEEEELVPPPAQSPLTSDDEDEDDEPALPPASPPPTTYDEHETTMYSPDSDEYEPAAAATDRDESDDELAIHSAPLPPPEAPPSDNDNDTDDDDDEAFVPPMSPPPAVEDDEEELHQDAVPPPAVPPPSDSEDETESVIPPESPPPEIHAGFTAPPESTLHSGEDHHREDSHPIPLPRESPDVSDDMLPPPGSPPPDEEEEESRVLQSPREPLERAGVEPVAIDREEHSEINGSPRKVVVLPASSRKPEEEILSSGGEDAEDDVVVESDEEIPVQQARTTRAEPNGHQVVSAAVVSATAPSLLDVKQPQTAYMPRVELHIHEDCVLKLVRGVFSSKPKFRGKVYIGSPDATERTVRIDKLSLMVPSGSSLDTFDNWTSLSSVTDGLYEAIVSLPAGTPANPPHQLATFFCENPACPLPVKVGCGVEIVETSGGVVGHLIARVVGNPKCGAKEFQNLSLELSLAGFDCQISKLRLSPNTGDFDQETGKIVWSSSSAAFELGVTHTFEAKFICISPSALDLVGKHPLACTVRFESRGATFSGVDVTVDEESAKVRGIARRSAFKVECGV